MAGMVLLTDGSVLVHRARSDLDPRGARRRLTPVRDGGKAAVTRYGDDEAAATDDPPLRLTQGRGRAIAGRTPSRR
jgi:hypothetical protein